MTKRCKILLTASASHQFHVGTVCVSLDFRLSLNGLVRSVPRHSLRTQTTATTYALTATSVRTSVWSASSDSRNATISRNTPFSNTAANYANSADSVEKGSIHHSFLPFDLDDSFGKRRCYAAATFEEKNLNKTIMVFDCDACIKTIFAIYQ